jgi:hypothetical protein
MDKMDHLMAEKKENNKDSQKGQVTPKNFFLNFRLNPNLQGARRWSLRKRGCERKQFCKRRLFGIISQHCQDAPLLLMYTFKWKE